MSASDRSQEALESSLRRLSVCTKVLSAAMLASLARIFLDGVNLALALTAAMVAVLLAASLVLWRHGRRLQQRAPNHDARHHMPPRSA